MPRILLFIALMIPLSGCATAALTTTLATVAVGAGAAVATTMLVNGSGPF